MQVLFLIAYAVLGAKLYISVIEIQLENMVIWSYGHMVICLLCFLFSSFGLPIMYTSFFFLSSQDKIMHAMYV